MSGKGVVDLKKRKKKVINPYLESEWKNNQGSESNKEIEADLGRRLSLTSKKIPEGKLPSKKKGFKVPVYIP